MDKISVAVDVARENGSDPFAARGIANAARHSLGSPLAEQAERALQAEGGANGSRVGRGRAFDPDPAWLERHRVLSHGVSGSVASAYRLLRTQVLDRMREHGYQTLGIVSPRAGDGKTTVAANLAITITSDPRHTALLVDLDLRNPGVASLFGIEPEIGVEHVIRGEADVEAALVRPTGYEGLRLLPAAGPVKGSSVLVTDSRCRALVGELRARYANRVTLFDVPPVLDADDALLVAPQLDCLLLVVGEDVTARSDVVRTLELTHRTPVIGTVLNRASDVPRSMIGM